MIDSHCTEVLHGVLCIFGCGDKCEFSKLLSRAARREAEASNPCKDPGACEVGGCLSPSACQVAAGEREGPGSAAAPTVEGLVAHAEVTADGELRLMTEEPPYEPPAFALRETWEIVALAMNQTADLLLNQNDPRYALLHEFANKLGERSEELKEYAKTLPRKSEREDKPTPAADELVVRLRRAAGLRGGFPENWDDWKAADRIEAQAREIAELKESEYAANKIAAAANGRTEASETRVRELEAAVRAASAAANARAAERDFEKARADRLAAAARDCIDMTENCAGVPTEPDSLPQMVKAHLKTAISTEGGDRG